MIRKTAGALAVGLLLLASVGAAGQTAKPSGRTLRAASHVAFISHPKVVARLIEQAATATAK